MSTATLRTRWSSILLSILLQWLPTVSFAFFLLWHASQHLSILSSLNWKTGTAFAAGALISLLIYISRLRFLPPFLLALLVSWIIKSLLLWNVNGDTDTVFIAHSFHVFSLLFFTGWLIQYILLRWRIGAIVTALIFIGLGIYLNARLNYIYQEDWNKQWLWLISPLFLFGIYIIYISEQLRNHLSKRIIPIRKMMLQTFSFLALCTILFLTFIYFIRNDINDAVEDIHTSVQSEGANSQLQKNEDGYSIKEETSMGPSNHRSNELLMAAYIDNYFEGTDIPNPLYLTAFYYASFDSVTETFQKGSDMPDKDLFQPNPNKIPLYSTLVDSSVLAFTKNNKGLKTVEVEVYNKALNPGDFVAPTTAFFIQPIAVHEDYQQEYKSAYRAKSYVSELNSAYFVYNSDHPEAVQFQNTRNSILRQVKDFSDMDSTIYQYYTHVPNIPVIQKIKQLTDSITRNNNLPIDQIIAIKNFFQAKDKNGKGIFKYTDNPGIPDIPSASKLDYFLFQNRQGYCAHYAGATLFMLRSLGIPSRIVAGFLTEDRSTTNPGWYYFYANQVHAWVQVYFPGFGWLDFDTTIGNDEARESEQTDATPPLQPTKASLAINAQVVAIDTISKTLKVHSQQLVFKDKNYTTPLPAIFTLQIEQAKIIADTTVKNINDIQINDSITAISYSEFNEINKNALNFENIHQSIADSAYIDLIQLKQKQKNTKSTVIKDNKNNISKWIWILVGLIAAGLIITALYKTPKWILQYYLRKSKHANIHTAVQYQYKALKYYLWMMDIYNERESLNLLAPKIDNKYNTQLQQYLNALQSYKYNPDTRAAKASMQSQALFLNTFIQQLQQSTDTKTYRKLWSRTPRALKYLFNYKNI